MEKRKQFNRLLQQVGRTAAGAIENLGDMVHYAGYSLVEKMDEAKLSCTLSRRTAEQEAIFTEIGRTLYLLQSDAFSDDTAERIDAQQELDHFLLLADRKQKEIDRLSEDLSLLAGCQVCPACDCVCKGADCFCSDCGEPLPLAGL